MTEYIAIGTAIYTVASLITRLTPTKKDDKIVGQIGKFWGLLFESTAKHDKGVKK